MRACLCRSFSLSLQAVGVLPGIIGEGEMLKQAIDDEKKAAAKEAKEEAAAAKAATATPPPVPRPPLPTEVLRNYLQLCYWQLTP